MLVLVLVLQPALRELRELQQLVQVLALEQPWELALPWEPALQLQLGRLHHHNL